MKAQRRKRSSSVTARNIESIRRDINTALIKSIMDTLTPHQRWLLGRTRGNPMIDFHLEQLIRQLMIAEQAIGGEQPDTLASALSTTHQT